MKKLSRDIARFKVAGSRSETEGAYQIPHPKIKGYVMQVIASDGEGWEHVSLTLRDANKKGKFVERTPTWSEMCFIKDVFWNPDEVVIQYHPAKSDYVNNHPHCLHLWRPLYMDIPVPDSSMVGI